MISRDCKNRRFNVTGLLQVFYSNVPGKEHFADCNIAQRIIFRSNYLMVCAGIK